MTTPTDLASAIDAVFQIDVQIKQHKTAMGVLEADRRALELAIIGMLNDGGLRMAGGHFAAAKIKPRVVFNALPGAEGWPVIHRHIQETGEFDLLNKRLTIKACEERWEVGATVPGVQRAEIPELKISALGE